MLYECITLLAYVIRDARLGQMILVDPLSHAAALARSDAA